jgi:hypothetical protein
VGSFINLRDLLIIFDPINRININNRLVLRALELGENNLLPICSFAYLACSSSHLSLSGFDLSEPNISNRVDILEGPDMQIRISR